jgi:hypothetical protein
MNMESVMQQLFYIDRLDPEDRRAIRRFHVAIAVFYPAVTMLVLAIVAARIGVLDPQIDAKRDRAAGVVEASQLDGATGAIAADPAGIARCAWRDLQIVTSIEVHGDAQDVPADKLRDAFFTMMKARAACSAGRINEAIAVYDGIIIGPAQPTGK